MKSIVSMGAALTVFLTAASASALEFHVSPSGSNKNPGTQAKPYQTIAHARDSVAKINSKMTGDIVVYLAGGTYEISESVVFDANDSGTNGHKVIYKAVAGQTPIVSGGKAIKNWELHDKEKNIYKAAVGDLEFRQIYVNGVRGIRSRYPNRTNEVTLGGYLLGGAVTGKAPFQFQVNPAELTGWETWKNLNEVEVVMVTHWKQKRARIASIAGNLISFQEPENAAPSMNHLEQGGTPHWYENAYEFLDAVGEFYLNTKTDTLYYKMRAEEKLPIDVIVPAVETLFDIRGSSPDDMVHDLLFEGITFQHSNWTKPNTDGYQVMQSATWYSKPGSFFDTETAIPAAVQLANANKVEIRSCTVRQTGAHGIAAVKDVVSNSSISGNLVTDTAAGGIYLLLNDEKSTGNTVADNTVETIGMCHTDSCGILAARTPDVAILHNEIRNIRYTGISTGWSWDDKDSTAKNHDIGYNLIHGTMGLHDDGGGIYTLGKIEGMKIHHNYIHNIARSVFSGNYGICGIYLDNGSCHKLVQDNVIENVEAAFFSGNKPNYKNTFERNYHMCPLAKIIEKENIVRDNVEVKKGAAWPAEAVKIMKEAGPRGAYRRPDYIWTKGRIGGAKAFNGGSEFIEVAHKPELEPEQLTLEAWIRMEEFPGGQDPRRWVVSKNANEAINGHYALMIQGDRAGVYLNVGGSGENLHHVLSQPASLRLNSWHHLAMTFDGSVLRLFIDGKEAGNKPVNAKRVAGSGALVIGRRPDGYNTTYFKGLVDDVRIYDRVLDASEMKVHFDKPTEVKDTKSEKGMLGYWPF